MTPRGLIDNLRDGTVSPDADFLQLLSQCHSTSWPIATSWTLRVMPLGIADLWPTKDAELGELKTTELVQRTLELTIPS